MKKIEDVEDILVSEEESLEEAEVEVLVPFKVKRLSRSETAKIYIPLLAESNAHLRAALEKVKAGTYISIFDKDEKPITKHAVANAQDNPLAEEIQKVSVTPERINRFVVHANPSLVYAPLEYSKPDRHVDEPWEQPQPIRKFVDPPKQTLEEMIANQLPRNNTQLYGMLTEKTHTCEACGKEGTGLYITELFEGRVHIGCSKCFLSSLPPAPPKREMTLFSHAEMHISHGYRYRPKPLTPETLNRIQLAAKAAIPVAFNTIEIYNIPEIKTTFVPKKTGIGGDFIKDGIVVPDGRRKKK